MRAISALPQGVQRHLAQHHSMQWQTPWQTQWKRNGFDNLAVCGRWPAGRVCQHHQYDGRGRLQSGVAAVDDVRLAAGYCQWQQPRGHFFQSLAGIRSFYRADRLPTHDVRQILLPTVVGGLVGAVLASVLPNTVLKPALLISVLAVAALSFFQPDLLLVPEGAQPRTVAATRGARLLLFLTGMYGGFVQASAGFLLLPLMTGLLHYDLVRANALKILCTLVFTTVSLLVFMSQGKIWWSVALVLAAGNTIGSVIGVKISLRLDPKIIRWILFGMTIVAAVAALFK